MKIAFLSRNGLVRIGIGLLALAGAQRAVAAEGAPHLEMEMSGREYARILESQDLNGSRFRNRSAMRSENTASARGDFQNILDMGKRFYQWLDKINQTRAIDKKISLSSAATQHAYPIESPRLSNPTLINDSYAALRTQLPDWMGKIVLDGDALTATIPVADDEFATLGRRVTDVYEAASRWVLEVPDLGAYAARKADDIRGYYFLSKEADLQAELARWGTLLPTKQQQLTEWLVDDCLNDGNSESTCQSQLAQDNAVAFYQRYQAAGQKKWNAYFAITTHRNDLDWTSSNPWQMNVPFQPPSVAAIQNFLSTNIENEWSFNGWQLRLAFSPSADSHLEFEAGATPHVNDLAGNTITMDENAPLTEYDVQWTIRHEFGHVLGFPDCYLEFYDNDSATMVSYQLDITNLMCSRRGHLQQRHVDELKRVYYRS